jgi:tetratricopeptide (TPR) repeat protein/2-polyprenyl-3-methyl-5-hydroxy-6-metoxy-1,4-benzoquinol methylase
LIFQPEIPMKKTGRNDPCPCGSGKKYKQCCMQPEAVAAADLRPARSIPNAIRAAVEHYHAGRFAQAETLARQVLQMVPDQPDALHLLGLMAYQVGTNHVAVELLTKAIHNKPSDPDYHLDLGNALQAQGSFEEAIRCYRQALALNPDFGEAHNNLGTVFQRVGKLDLAIASYRKALAHSPQSSDLHYNLGNALKDQGRLDEAITCYQKVLSLTPNHVTAQNNLGAALQQRGDLDGALAGYDKALSLKPDYAEAHYNRGLVFQTQGKLDAAIACYSKALSFKADYAEAHNELGSALADQGRLDDAIASYRQALSLRPDYAQAHNNLGYALQQEGRFDEAVASYGKALSAKPEFAQALNNLGHALSERGLAAAALASYRRALELEETGEFKTSFVRCIRNIDFIEADAGLRQLVTRALSEPWARPGDLVDTSIRLIMLDPKIRECIERAVSAWPTRLSGADLFGPHGVSALAHDLLLRSLLENAHVCTLSMERFLTMVRHALLDAATQTANRTDLGDDTLAFYCAVARQCFVNEFVFSYTEEEFARAQSLRENLVADLQAGKAVAALSLVAVAAYFPLLSVPHADTLPHQPWPEPVRALLLQQITEPLREQGYRDGMRRLTAVADGVSRLVRQQYEENPYPRWITLPQADKARSLGSYLRHQFPFASFHSVPTGDAIDILIAGCGTGQESIETAQQFPAARVLAVDLSLSSLCYAQRKSDERGLNNIEYAQGDITQLGSIGRMFDLIVSVGVLHHLADPMAGWRELLSLLRPGGLMLLGFYSECARGSVVAARRFIAEHGYLSTAEDIRRCRQDLIDLDNGALSRQLTSYRDFYAISECRDLLFHVQEHRLTLPQIKAMLAQLGLEFMGFLLEPHSIRRYKESFPNDRSLTNLDNWNEFETWFPDTFIGSYVFWTRKTGVTP